MSQHNPNKPKIVFVIDPSLHTPEVECFNNLLDLSPVNLHYYLAAMGKTRSFMKPEFPSFELKGIIVLGSAASVNDKFPWQNELCAWLETQFAKQVPTLGICFGHQLFAHMNGERVDYVKQDHSKLVGFREIEFEPSPLTEGKRLNGELAVSHNQAAFNCPKGWRIMAKSRDIACDGFAHETLPIWSLQAHPEAVPEFFRGAVSDSVARPARFPFGHSLMKNFLAYCAENSPKL